MRKLTPDEKEACAKDARKFEMALRRACKKDVNPEALYFKVASLLEELDNFIAAYRDDAGVENDVFIADETAYRFATERASGGYCE
ncbi:MAG TPA: hypothetical protein VFQ70_02055 [Candidatus Saccharimonadaceae bacterium]|nr:hypothetical protein [Candidatus Saccharimonadaceae bacterium]